MNIAKNLTNLGKKHLLNKYHCVQGFDAIAPQDLLQKLFPDDYLKCALLVSYGTEWSTCNVSLFVAIFLCLCFFHVDSIPFSNLVFLTI